MSVQSRIASWRSLPGEVRLQRSLRRSFAVHLIYGTYKAALAVWCESAWFAASAGYYVLLSAAQLFLLRGKSGGARRSRRYYRLCGWLLLGLTAAIAAVNEITLRENRAAVYPWHLIYGAAAYTFYSLTMALIRLARAGKGDLVAQARGILSLSAALVAVFSLQMALLAAFGDGGAWQYGMSIATGSAVFLAVAIMALHMIFRKIEI